MYLEVGVTCIKVTGESLEVQEHAVTEDSWEGDHEKNDSHAGEIKFSTDNRRPTWPQNHEAAP